MLPEIIQRVFDEYRQEQALQQFNQLPNLDFQFQLDSDYHYKQLVREIRRDRYIIIGVTIAVGIAQAIYFTYLFS